MPKLDEIDIKILKALLKDARCSFADIAKDCNVSITAIAQRFKKMKRTGIITGTILILGKKSPRDKYFFSLDIKTESGFESSLMKSVEKMPNFVNGYSVIGEYDIHAVFCVNSLEQIVKIRNGINKHREVL